MVKKILVIVSLVLVFCITATALSYAAEKESMGAKVKNFWQKLFNYPANVTKESASVVADTGKGGVQVVTDEVKRVGQVTSGELNKTPQLITEPIKGTGETTYKAVTDTAKIPVEAAKEEPAQAAANK